MVFTHGPSAHLPCLATRAGFGRITRSSGIARFVQGGVVKTFRWTSQLNVVQVTFAPDDADDLNAIARPAKEDHVVPATETSTRPVIHRRPALTHFRILRQRLTRCLDFFYPAVCRFGLVSRNELRIFVQI
jgi:hypothetical protein